MEPSKFIDARTSEKLLRETRQAIMRPVAHVPILAPMSRRESEVHDDGATMTHGDGGHSVQICFWEPSLPHGSSSRFIPWVPVIQMEPAPENATALTTVTPQPIAALPPSSVPLAPPLPWKLPCFEPPLTTEPCISSGHLPRRYSEFGVRQTAQVANYQIVLYKDSRIVLYDHEHNRVGVRALRCSEEEAIRMHRMSVCPMCGQSIEPTRFSFEAQSYFRILQEVIRNHIDSQQRPFGRFATSASPQGTPRPRGLSELSWSSSLLNFFGDTSTTTAPNAFSGHTSGFIGVNDAAASHATNPFVTSETSHVTASTTQEPGTSASGTTPSNGIPIPQNLPSGMFITGYYANFFREIRRLGTGSYGQVFLCHHLLDDVYLGEYAVKKVPVGDDRAWLQKMLREVKIRERLHNTNIVQYKHSWLEMHRTTTTVPVIPWLFVLMEYCNGGDLERYLELGGHIKLPLEAVAASDLTPMPESHIWKLFFDIANGLNHLHHSGILHRDLKPQNILLQCTLDTLTGRPTTTALLSDFGTSELLSEKDRYRHREGYTGTVEFTAPELLEQDESGHLRDDYDEKSDVWSLGIIVYVMAYGQLPYFGSDPKECRARILTHTDPRLLIPETPKRSDDLRLLIEALLQRNPDARPSIDAIINHRKIRNRMADISLETAGYEITYTLGCRHYQATQAGAGTREPPPTAPIIPPPRVETVQLGLLTATPTDSVSNGQLDEDMLPF